MALIKDGDTVKVHYTGKLSDGSGFDTSTEGDPLEFVIGEHLVIKGFEDTVRSMNSGEKKTVTIPSDEAYGPHRDELLIEAKKEELPDDVELKVGEQIIIVMKDNTEAPAKIIEIADEKVTLDANHPLAGKDLIFELELVEVNPAGQAAPSN
jgi:FKBP-type peptidyl-prolyl cis-trans isomerase 2